MPNQAKYTGDANPFDTLLSPPSQDGSIKLRKRHYVCILISQSKMLVNTRKLIAIYIFFFGASSGIAQQKPSRKEIKLQERKIEGSRYFIEGEKALLLGNMEKAFHYLSESRELLPKEPAISYKIAEVLFRSGHPEQALSYAEFATAADPDNKYYALMVAEIHNKLKQPLKAAEILDRLTADGLQNQQYNLDLASIYLNEGKFDKALIVLDRAEDYYGVRESLTTQKQRIYLRKNDLQNAIKEGEKLIASFPGNPDHVLRLVEILYNNSRLDQALELVFREMDKYPTQPELQMAAYTLLKEKGLLDEANDHLLKAFQSPDLDPSTKARTFLSILDEMQTVERDSLLNRMESLMQKSSPNDAAVLAAIGNRKEANGQLNEAVTLYKKSLQVQPKNAKLIEKVILNSFGKNADFRSLETYTIMGVDEFPESPKFWFYDGVVKASQKHDSLAISSLKKSIQLNAGNNTQLDQMAYGTLGSSLYNLGRKDSAFQYFDKALLLNPNDDQVLNNYAYFLSLEKEELQKALSMSEKVVKKYPDNATYLDTHAWVLFQMGSYQEALEYMDKAIQVERKPSGTMLEHYGDILYHLGKIQEAVSWWKKAQETTEASSQLPKKIKEKKYHE